MPGTTPRISRGRPVVEAFAVDEQHRETLLGGESGEGLIQRGSRQELLGRVRSRWFPDRVVSGDGRLMSLAAQMIETGRVGDATEPGPGARISAERGQPSEGPQRHLLQDVVHGLPIAHRLPCDVAEPPIVEAENVDERAVVAAPGGGQQGRRDFGRRDAPRLLPRGGGALAA